MAALFVLSGCASSRQSCAGTGRYQIAISEGMAVMTDTTTGQAWASAVAHPGGFLNKDFGKPKNQ